MLLPLLILGCTQPEGDSAVQIADTEEDVVHQECNVAEIHINGDDPPQVGTEWEVFLWCDGRLQTGASRLIFDPSDIATVAQYRATFVKSGDATMTIQVGSWRQSRDVTVSE